METNAGVIPYELQVCYFLYLRSLKFSLIVIRPSFARIISLLKKSYLVLLLTHRKDHNLHLNLQQENANATRSHLSKILLEMIR